MVTKEKKQKGLLPIEAIAKEVARHLYRSGARAMPGRAPTVGRDQIGVDRRPWNQQKPHGKRPWADTEGSGFGR